MKTEEDLWTEEEVFDDRPIEGEDLDRRRFLGEPNDPRYTLLSMELEGKDAEYRSRVYRLVDVLGIDPEDPVFLLLLSTGRIDAEVRQFPENLSHHKRELSTLFDQWSDKVMSNLDEYERVIKDRLKSYEAVAKKIHQREMDQILKTLIGKIAVREVLRDPIVLVLASIVSLATLGAGAALSYFYWQAKVQYEPGDTRLTRDQAQLLQWAESAEGKYAKNLVEWNRNLLADRECVAQAEKAGVTLQVEQGGQKAKSGFCILWVDPPSQRKFASPSQ